MENKSQKEPRIPVWNERHRYLFQGYRAPFQSDLGDFLEHNRDFEVYVGQDEALSEEERNERVVLWHTTEHRRVVGTSAPKHKNLGNVLEACPYYAVYTNQDILQDGSRKKQRGRGVMLWNTRINKKVCGSAAPFEKNLLQHLRRHPHLEIYSGQDHSSADGELETLSVMYWRERGYEIGSEGKYCDAVPTRQDFVSTCRDSDLSRASVSHTQRTSTHQSFTTREFSRFQKDSTAFVDADEISASAIERTKSPGRMSQESKNVSVPVEKAYPDPKIPSEDKCSFGFCLDDEERLIFDWRLFEEDIKNSPGGTPAQLSIWMKENLPKLTGGPSKSGQASDTA